MFPPCPSLSHSLPASPQDDMTDRQREPSSSRVSHLGSNQSCSFLLWVQEHRFTQQVGKPQKVAQLQSDFSKVLPGFSLRSSGFLWVRGTVLICVVSLNLRMDGFGVKQMDVARDCF